MNITEIINNFHFIRPKLLFLISIVIIYYIARLIYHSLKPLDQQYKNKNTAWQYLCSESILDFLYQNSQTRVPKYINFLQNIIWLLVIIALAGPSWQKKEVPLYQNQDSWVIALSLAQSMEKTDITPSRLQRAKYKIKDFTNYIKDQQLGLIVFAKDAYDIIPITTDKKTVEHILPSLEPLIMPEAGSDVGTALTKAYSLIKNLKLKSSNILLITDDSANSESLLSAKDLSKNKIAVYTININKYANNNISNSLAELSRLSNGLYTTITNDDSDLKSIIAHAESRFKSNYDQNLEQSKIEVWHDMGPWLLPFILPLLFIFLFARERSSSSLTTKLSKINHSFLSFILTSLIIYIFSLNLIINTSYAASTTNTLSNTIDNITNSQLWQDIWYNKQQQTAKKLANNKEVPHLDPRIFTNPKWQAAAKYKNNNFKDSADILSKHEDMTSKYNLANSLAKQGKITEAIAKYDEILKLEPKHTDAKYNKELLEDFLKQMSDKNKQGSNDGQQNQDKTQDQNSQDNNQTNQKNQQDNSADHQNQENQKNQENQNNQANKNKTSPEEPEKMTQKSLDENKDKAQENKQQSEQESKEDMANNNEQDAAQQQQKNQQALTKATKSDSEINEWLDKIPDNPANYLRNQLQYEYWKNRQE